MANPSYGAANLQWLGIATEVTPNTAIATPSLFVPCDTPVWTSNTENLTDTALRGSMSVEFEQIKGLRYDQVTFKTNMYLDTAFAFFRAVLGLPDVISGTPTGSGATTVAAPTIAGATTITGAVTITTGSTVQIGTGATAEIRVISTSGTTFTVAPLTYAHAGGEAITPLNTAVGYSHKTSVQSGNNGQPATTTVFFYDAQGKAWQMAGSMCSEVKVTINTGGLATLEVTYIGLPAVPITPPSNTPGTNLPMPAWSTTITVAAAALTKYSQVTFDLKRDVKPIDTITGTQAPFAIFSGGFTCSGTLDGVYTGSTDVDLQANLQNNQPTLVVKIAPVGDAVNSITIQASQTGYDDTKVAGTTEWMTVSGTLKFLANPTDVAAGGNQSPLLVTMVSPVTTLV